MALPDSDGEPMDVDPQLEEELTELEPPARGEAVAESQAHCSQAVSKQTKKPFSLSTEGGLSSVLFP